MLVACPIRPAKYLFKVFIIKEINMSAQNLTLLTDLYELTMMQGYFETQENETVVFDVFFRDNPNKG